MFHQTTVVGRLGKTAEVNSTKAGNPYAKFSVAATEHWKDKGGQKQEHTTWYNVILWGQLANAIGHLLEKGMLVFAQGRIKTEEYTDRDGVKRWGWTLHADTVRILGGGKYRATGRGGSNAPHGDDPETGSDGGDPGSATGEDLEEGGQLPF